jgi:phosphocarrier protein
MGLLSRKPETASQSITSKELTIVNKLGLHARPSAKFVKTANQFKCEVWVEKDGEKVNGKSIMGLMMLAAGQGSKLLVSCEGPDGDKALAAIEEIITRKFDED